MGLYVAFGKQVFDFIDKIELFFTNLFLNIKELAIELKHFIIDVALFFTTLKGILILSAILLPFILYYNYKWTNVVLARIKERKDERERLEREEENIKKLIRTNPQSLGLKGLGEYIEDVKAKINFSSKKFRKYKSDLMKKLPKAKRVYELKDYENRIKEYKELEKNYDELFDIYEKRRKKEEREKEQEKRAIYRELTMEDTNVFYKEELNEEEIAILKENEFKQVNEYDIFSKNSRTFLIKSPLNHSPTHTFLVWSVMKVVEDIKGVDRIEEHLTRDADITFRYKKKYYALEIETGNLLSKKVQLKAKVAMLNRKYGNRWMFVVSNQEDLPKYRKWGKSTQRTEVEKVLENWLE